MLAGFVDAIAGGGGLIALPALLAAGLPPVLALGTNKVQSVIGTAAAAITYWRGGFVSLKALGLAIACTFAASFVGAFVVKQIDVSVPCRWPCRGCWSPSRSISSWRRG